MDAQIYIENAWIWSPPAWFFLWIYLGFYRGVIFSKAMTPESPAGKLAFALVLLLQPVVHVAYPPRQTRPEFFGAPITSWASVCLLAFVWIRTLYLVLRPPARKPILEAPE